MRKITRSDLAITYQLERKEPSRNKGRDLACSFALWLRCSSVTEALAMLLRRALPEAKTPAPSCHLNFLTAHNRTDLVVGVEESTDLTTWTPATVSSTTTVSDTGSIRTYKAKVPLNAAEKKFLRLKITALTN